MDVPYLVEKMFDTIFFCCLRVIKNYFKTFEDKGHWSWYCAITICTSILTHRCLLAIFYLLHSYIDVYSIIWYIMSLPLLRNITLQYVLDNTDHKRKSIFLNEECQVVIAPAPSVCHSWPQTIIMLMQSYHWCCFSIFIQTEIDHINKR